jgi:hypothetical protein
MPDRVVRPAANGERSDTGEVEDMDPVALGKLAATGWRSKVADAVAEPVSRKAPVEPDQVRAAVGGIFFLLSLYYVIQTIRRATQEIRG